MAAALDGILSEKAKVSGKTGGGGGVASSPMDGLQFVWVRDTEDVDVNRCCRVVAQHIEASHVLTAGHNQIHYSGDKGAGVGGPCWHIVLFVLMLLQSCVSLLVCCVRLSRVVDVVVDSQLFDVHPCV